jgi:hypothetical protein
VIGWARYVAWVEAIAANMILAGNSTIKASYKMQRTREDNIKVDMENYISKI